jgi:hypothetical protein
VQHISSSNTQALTLDLRKYSPPPKKFHGEMERPFQPSRWKMDLTELVRLLSSLGEQLYTGPSHHSLIRLTTFFDVQSQRELMNSRAKATASELLAASGSGRKAVRPASPHKSVLLLRLGGLLYVN